ncbi:hypothetical protein [Candidatus Finniella inopinata]|uniref:Uncharacterized protein n=1 Tax=Candidatus Finniella inopinata TaxID=1696036 RepID=A0A4Q7DEL6_9PROT|nr:hypothetical protein [Candidatus Finniella inopinata]RZI45113.1 hypothetical protein EQU50_08235 [Candidatus Finniella inopinata]
MQNDVIRWKEVVPKVLSTKRTHNIVRFSASKNPSGSVSGLCYISKDVALKAGLEVGGNVQVFVNPDDPRQFLFKPNQSGGAYTLSRTGSPNKTFNFARVNFRLEVPDDDMREEDFRIRTVKHVVNQADSSLMVDINWEKSE